MLADILNKILVVIFFMSCLNVLRHVYYFIQAFVMSNEETPIKYRLSSTALIFLGLSVSYILSVLLTGIML
jgi:hypothetical protein